MSRPPPALVEVTIPRLPASLAAYPAPAPAGWGTGRWLALGGCVSARRKSLRSALRPSWSYLTVSL